MSNEIRFYEHKSLAGHLEPGDATRYEMVAVQSNWFDSVLFWFYSGGKKQETAVSQGEASRRPLHSIHFPPAWTSDIPDSNIG